MIYYSGLLFLVIAVSMDGFGVGITYGMRKIRVPFFALFIIMFCSGFIVLLSMVIGNLLGSFISPQNTKVLGGCILIFLGVFSLTNVLRSKSNTEVANRKATQNNETISSFRKVLTTPIKADLDDSGTISASEAVLLGTALALDAFGAGLGASMIGYSPFLATTLIASMSGIFLYSGIKIGLILSRVRQLQNLTYVPPILLILLGMFNIM